MKQIEVGECYLRELLGGNVRLRLHGNVVRIEADKTSFGKLLEHGDEIVKTLKNLVLFILPWIWKASVPVVWMLAWINNRSGQAGMSAAYGHMNA